MRDFAHSLPMLLLRAREASMDSFRNVLNQDELTEQQWRVLRVLRESKGVEITELARQTLMLQPSLTGVVQRLERDGLVQRKKHSADGRKSCIDMTRKGKSLYAKIAPKIEHEYAAIQKCFTKKEWHGLYQSLQQLIDVNDKIR